MFVLYFSTILTVCMYIYNLFVYLGLVYTIVFLCHKMGVTGLWSILEPVKEHKSLCFLQGQILAVDLSIWVVENQGVRQMQHSVVRPYLRYGILVTHFSLFL